MISARRNLQGVGSNRSQAPCGGLKDPAPSYEVLSMPGGSTTEAQEKQDATWAP